MCVYDSHLSSVVVILQLAEAGGLQALPHAAQLRMQQPGNGDGSGCPLASLLVQVGTASAIAPPAGLDAHSSHPAATLTLVSLPGLLHQLQHLLLVLKSREEALMLAPVQLAALRQGLKSIATHQCVRHGELAQQPLQLPQHLQQSVPTQKVVLLKSTEVGCTWINSTLHYTEEVLATGGWWQCWCTLSTQEST